MESSRRSHASGYMSIAAAAIIWGSLPILIRLLTVPEIVIIAYRCLFTVVAAGIVAMFNRDYSWFKLDKAGTRKILGLSIALAANYIFFIRAVRETTIANASLLTYLSPVFVAVFAPAFIKERLHRITAIALSISLCGIYFVSGIGLYGLEQISAKGLFYGIGSGLCYAIVVLISKATVSRMSAIEILLYQFILMSAIFSPAIFFYPYPPLRDLLLILILGVVHNYIAAIFYLKGLRTIKAQSASIIAYLDPLTAILYGAVIFRETPNVLTYVGGAMIIVAGYLIISKTPINPAEELHS